MKIAQRDLLYTYHSRMNQPALHVAFGETFQVDTELCTGSWLKSIDDRYSREKARGPNPAVVIAVEGARPGESLAVDILAIEVDTLGYTGFDGADNFLARQILDQDWGLTTKTVAIRDGLIHWSDRLKLPIKPMIGTLGTAPAQEVISNAKGGRHGGNMDVNEVTIGSTIYLPVDVPDALLHVGDVHAIQGDGEINQGGGIECRSRVTLKVRRAERPAGMRWIRAENEDYIMAIACDRSLEESFHAASAEVLDWMTEAYGFSQQAAYLLMGQLLEARCTQFVNPTRSYICKMPKKYLIP